MSGIFVQLPANSTGEKIDVAQMADGLGNNVDRQVITIGDPATFAAKVKVQNADPGSSDYGLTVRTVRGTSANPMYIGRVLPTTASLSRAVVNFNTTGDNTIIAAVAGQTIRIFGMLLVATALTNIVLKHGTTAETGAIPLLQYGDFFLQRMLEEPYFVSASGEAFIVNQSGTATLTGTVWFTQS